MVKGRKESKANVRIAGSLISYIPKHTVSSLGKWIKMSKIPIKKDNVWLWKIVFSYLLLYITWLHFIQSWFCSNFKYTSITVFQWHFKEIIEWNVNSVKSIINLQWKCQIMGNLGYISYRLEMRFFFGVQHVLSIFTFLIKQSDLLFLRSKANTQELEKEKGPHLSVSIVSYCDSQLMRTNKNIHVHFDRFYW